MAQWFEDGSTPFPDDREPGPPPRPSVEVSRSDARSTVTVTGVLDRAMVTEVSGAVGGLVAGDGAEIVVDLTHACDGAALLPLLARTRADMVDQGGALWLVGIAVPEFLPALAVAPLEEVFLVYDAVRRDLEGTRTRRSPERTGSVPRRTDWPHPTRTDTSRHRAPDGDEPGDRPRGRGAHRAR